MKPFFLLTLLAAAGVVAKNTCGGSAYRCGNLVSTDKQSRKTDGDLTENICRHRLGKASLCHDCARRFYCDLDGHLEVSSFKWYCEQEGQQYTFEKANHKERCPRRTKDGRKKCSVS